MFAVPTNVFVGRGSSSEALIVAEPAKGGEAYASVADNTLVSEQRGRAGRGVVYQHLDVDVPCFHPGGEIADRALGARFLLRNHYVPVRGRGVVREPQRERGGGAHAVPCRVQRLWQ